MAYTEELAVSGIQVVRFWCFLLEIRTVGFGDWIFREGEHGRDVKNDAQNSNLTN